MKKIICIFMICICMILPLSVSARTSVCIDDQASLLDNDHYFKLEERAKEIVSKHSFDLLIVSSSDLNGLTPEEYADGIYMETEFGEGIDRDGLIVVFCFGENKGYCFYPTGIGNKIFTSEVAEQLFNEAYPHYINTDDYEFFLSLLNGIDKTLTEYTPPARVIDNADLLDNTQEAELKARIEQINTTYNFDAVLITVKEVTEKALPGHTEAEYKKGLYGFGENNDGVLFAISSPSGANFVYTSGYGKEVFTKYGAEEIKNHLSTPISQGRYYEAFTSFLDDTELFLSEAFKNEPYDESNPVPLKFTGHLPLIITATVLLVLFAAIWLIAKKFKHKK